MGLGRCSSCGDDAPVHADGAASREVKIGSFGYFCEATSELVDKLITRSEKSSHKGLLFDKLRARSRGLMGRRRSICGGAGE